MKSRSTVFCHVTTRTKTNNLTVHAHTLIAPKWSISHLCFQFAEDSQVEMKNRPSQWFTALCCRSSLSTHWNFSPPRLFMHTFQLSSGINITTKGMACIRGHAFFPLLKVLSKFRYSYQIIHWFEYNDRKKVLMLTTTVWHISTFWLTKDQISTLRLRNSKSQEAFRLCCMMPKGAPRKPVFTCSICATITLAFDSDYGSQFVYWVTLCTVADG